VVRTERPAAEMEQAIRRAIASIDPAQPVFLSVSMRELIGDSVADRRFIMTLLAATGILALLLAAAGVYGVISYTTSRRTPEFGIRIALGATPRNLLSLVFRQAFVTVALGIALGLAAALTSTRLLRTLLPGLETARPIEIVIASTLVASAAALACWIPARRTTRIDPMSALRHE
jgi:putative ABC transport system permease protein